MTSNDLTEYCFRLTSGLVSQVFILMLTIGSSESQAITPLDADSKNIVDKAVSSINQDTHLVQEAVEDDMRRQCTTGLPWMEHKATSVDIPSHKRIQ